MQTQEIDGEIYTYVDEETYVNSRGGEWVLWERPDMVSKIEWCKDELAKLDHSNLSWDDAGVVEELNDIIRDTEESLEIVDQLWGIW